MAALMMKMTKADRKETRVRKLMRVFSLMIFHKIRNVSHRETHFHFALSLIVFVVLRLLFILVHI